ncbi:MAG TPA: signal peptidase I [Candidatus Saccharimonadales bacterium]|nr:signal peptidase I [Candidatus Saccharimonadales bacterium]
MGRFVKVFFYGLLAGAVAASLAGLVFWKFEGLKLYGVQTDSMAPALRRGDLAISLKPAQLQPGDIISYHSSNNASRIISHRLVQIYPAKGYAVTKGDNLAQPDPAVPLSSITGKTVKVLPNLGYAADALRNPAGLIGLVYLPALALSAYELSRLINYLSYRPYWLR